MDATPEQWRPVVGYEGLYEISDCGRVKSVARKVLRRRAGRRDHYITIIERILRPCRVKRGGYFAVQLSKDGIERSYKVHHMVLDAFVGPRLSSRSDGRHLNDVPTDNRLSNLAWGTRADNQHDMLRNGNHANAKKTHCKWGHEFTPENTKPQRSGRACRECHRINGRKRDQRKRLERAMNATKDAS
jgi:hypothetical protein